MRAPIFLSLAEVVEIHNDQIRRYGGSKGIRDSDPGGRLYGAMVSMASGKLDKAGFSDILETLKD